MIKHKTVTQIQKYSDDSRHNINLMPSMISSEYHSTDPLNRNGYPTLISECMQHL